MRLFLLLFCCYNAYSAFSQSTIQGKVESESKETIVRAAIIIKPKGSDNILDYTFSNSEGNYKFNLNTKFDSLEISVKCLGFKTITKLILNKSQNINFVLEEGEIELQELKVKSPPIRKKGDTLSYSVEAFSSKNDRVIGDVIRKLPGMEVDSDGTIRYQGTAINKFYIEGLDLLKGKYNLANENLNVGAVKDVQIIENHQPIKMLDSLVLSNQAALNLKLKKGVAAAGQVYLGAGLAPFLVDANITPMLFAKNKQMINSIQYNNTGKNLSQQLKVIYYKPGMDNFNINDSKEDWMDIIQIYPPSVPAYKWLKNNVFLGTFNTLQKLKNDYQVRLNIDFSNDVQRQMGIKSTTYFLENRDTVSFQETIANKLIFKKAVVGLSFEKNSKNIFFENNTKFHGYWDSQQGKIERNDGKIEEHLNNPYFLFSNHFKEIFKFGKDLISLNSYFKIDKAPQNLKIIPGQFEAIFNNNLPYRSMIQSLESKNLFWQNDAAFRKFFKGLSWQGKLGFIIDRKSLNSDIDTGLEVSKISIKNGQTANKYDAYFDNELQKQKKGWNFTLGLPFTWIDFKISDKNLDRFDEVKKVVFEPKFNISKSFAKYWDAFIFINKKYSIENNWQVYYAYLLKDYRTLQRNDFPISQVVSWNYSANLKYRNTIAGVFGSLQYHLSKSSYNLLLSNTLNEDGSRELTSISGNNKGDKSNVSFNLNKYFSGIYSTFGIGADYFNFNAFRLINGDLINVNNRSIMPNAKIIFSFLQNFQFDYNFKLSRTDNNLNSFITKQQEHELNLKFNVFENSFLGFNLSYYQNNFNQKSKGFFFADLILRQTLKARKLDLEIDLNNIFNVKELMLISSNTYILSQTFYQFRPRQVLFKARFPL